MVENEDWVEIWGKMKIADELNKLSVENVIMEVISLVSYRYLGETDIEPGVLVKLKPRKSE